MIKRYFPTKSNLFPPELEKQNDVFFHGTKEYHLKSLENGIRAIHDVLNDDQKKYITNIISVLSLKGPFVQNLLSPYRTRFSMVASSCQAGNHIQQFGIGQIFEALKWLLNEIPTNIKNDSHLEYLRTLLKNLEESSSIVIAIELDLEQIKNSVEYNIVYLEEDILGRHIIGYVIVDGLDMSNFKTPYHNSRQEYLFRKSNRLS